MAAVQCTKCTAERKGFRRELDSWRHRLIHCVGFECILEGIYGPILLKDLNLFVGCEPEEVDDWSPEASRSQCSFCNLSLDKLSDPVPAAMSPSSSPSDLSPCQALTISESSQSAHRFLQAVFHKKDVSMDCDSNIPLVAQELMKKMIREFAVEYASKCLLRTNTNGVTRSSSPLSETSDAPLDLTVSRMLEEKEIKPEPDGVLDLSNRNFASSATSSSSNHKVLGFQLPSVTEELGDLGRRGTKFHQSSTLDAVLHSLCSAHRSLLYQILKLAHQEKLLQFLNHKHVSQTESHCCHCGVSPLDTFTPHSAPFNECKAYNHSMYCTSANSSRQSHCSAVYHPGDSKTGCSIHHHPFRSCNSEGHRGSSYGCVQRRRMENLCSNRLPCVSCQSFAVGHRNSIASSFVPSSVVSQSPSCTHSCSCHPNHTCLRQVKNIVDRGVGDGDHHCPVLQREQSPSPPPLSPIPSDISKKTNEKPPALHHHRQVEKAEPMVKCISVSGSHMVADVATATDNEPQCKTPENSQADQNPSGTLLQDVVNRFSQKLETITSIDREPTLLPTPICVTEKEQPQFPSTSQNLQCHADAHLTEIITTVLHTGRASDYSLSELFNKHDKKEPKSPNTRYRRRQEVLVAIATPADDASTRRQSLQIKRELARLDQSYNRRRGPPTKKARLKDGNHSITTSGTSPDPDLVKEVSDGNHSITTSGTSPDPDLVKEVSKRKNVVVEPVENHKVLKATLSMLSAERDREETEEAIKTVITEELEAVKGEESEREISEKKQLTLSNTQIQNPELQCTHKTQDLKEAQTQVITVNATSTHQYGSSCREDCKGGCDTSLVETPSIQSFDTDNTPGKDSSSPVKEGQKCQSVQCKGVRKSTRNIVPPQWILSYVTEPRLFIPASISDSIFNSTAQNNKALTSSTLDSFSKDANNVHLKSESGTHLSSQECIGKLAYKTPKKHCELSNTEIKVPYQSLSQTTVKESSEKHSPEKRADDIDCGLSRRLRSSSRLEVPDMPKNSSNADVTIKSISVESPFSSQIQYTSPIKLMFVSPVKDKGGVKYSLKSAGSGSTTQTEEPFDPYEESSWSGAPQKHKRQSRKCASVQSVILQCKSATLCTRSASSPVKSAFSPAKTTSSPAKSAPSPAKSASSTAKSASSPAKSAFSPAKTTSSPAKSASSPTKSASSPAKSTPSPAKSASSSAKSASSPAKSASSPAKSASSPAKSTPSPAKSASSPAKSASSPAKSTPLLAKTTSFPMSAYSPPKSGSRRSSDSTPSKRLSGTESQHSPDDLPSPHETTPPKRRPGRPKKLGPHLEQKVKRPIGRPRKQKAVDAAASTETRTLNGKCLVASDSEDSVNKNLKITVVYGRSRRNKRMVSEGFDKLQTDFSDVLQGVDLKGDLGIFLHRSKKSSSSIKTASEEINLVSPAKEPAPQSGGNIKFAKRDESAPSRKPGRPAKVKISGISVTVTTVSPRQRKILINKDKQQSPETHLPKKALLPEVTSAKEPRTISCQLTSKRSQMEEGLETNKHKDELPNRSVAVRHSMRVRKPSIHFLHAVATSGFRSYSHSNALLRRSKQLLLTKESNERRQEEQQRSVKTSGKKRQFYGQERASIPQDLSKVAAVSVESIFSPKETLRWWAASAEEQTLNQELARRIRLISDTWVTDTAETQDDEISLNSTLDTQGSSSLTRKSKNSSVVRALFDCSPNKPRSCSMQQVCSWFMQTTETQSLAIVKKASSRNPYELMHFPRSANKESVCHSPQAERLRKHIKKFAKTVPKSPLQHQQAQRRLKKNKVRRQLFIPRFAMHKRSRGVLWWRCNSSGKYKATLVRARSRFLTQKERKTRQKKRGNKKKRKVTSVCLNRTVVTGQRPSRKASHRSVKDQFSDCLESNATCSVNRTQELVDAHKEQNLSSKAWSPETLKECRVFLRKINSPDSESAEEWDSCTVTLDDGSPSAYLFAGKERELVQVVEAVKSERKRSTSNTRQQTDSVVKSVQKQDAVPAGRQRCKRSPGVVSTELPQPPPAKKLRQSRMRGLTGPRWCDFVFEN
ncbi:microtubule-associated protein futsch-like isoform X2 [Melanotaenia boesemani]|uniref:microtubule-associated protein futsch-like isoform X2 n=1 Tax=Melanotaenia boesemani TaxID=1250792 RepID=UPI001C041F91|nr:microtubule-associated protein futsch-like isoform X2 [Melanotaenia boesemani]